VNGAGKSSILDCAAILLSRLTAAISSPKSTGRLFFVDDINNNAPFTTCSITVNFEGQDYTWSMSKSRPGTPHNESSDISNAKQIAEIIQKRLVDDKTVEVPLAIFYPVNRAVLDIPSRIRGKHSFDQIAAYYGALTGAQNNFRLFFEWFREREDLENEKIRREWQETSSPRPFTEIASDRELDAVRKAIPRLLPGFKNLHIQRAPHRMVLEKDGMELIVNQLSDGEKCTLALVGDLARRMALAAPSAPNPLEVPAIVMIDEVDLHMHPGWQRNVVPSLQETFPNCQFILSTHSPQVVSEVKSQHIWLMNTKTKKAEHPQSAYGLDSNRILEDIMEVPERPQEIKEMLETLFAHIDTGNLNAARAKIESLRNLIGSDPELTKAAILIRRKEVLGK
jgi:predicted ATP-binding protein involved in virulence